MIDITRPQDYMRQDGIPVICFFDMLKDSGKTENKNEYARTTLLYTYSDPSHGGDIVCKSVDRQTGVYSSSSEYAQHNLVLRPPTVLDLAKLKKENEELQNLVEYYRKYALMGARGYVDQAAPNTNGVYE